MAKSKGKTSKRGRRGVKMTLPISVLAGFASPVARTVQHGIDYGIMGQEGAIAELSRTMTGMNPFQTPMAFEGYRLRYGLLPILVGIGVHKLAGMLGVNRAIARAGIPLIRI